MRLRQGSIIFVVVLVLAGSMWTWLSALSDSSSTTSPATTDQSVVGEEDDAIIEQISTDLQTNLENQARPLIVLYLSYPSKDGQGELLSKIRRVTPHAAEAIKAQPHWRETAEQPLTVNRTVQPQSVQFDTTSVMAIDGTVTLLANAEQTSHHEATPDITVRPWVNITFTRLNNAWEITNIVYSE